jgi:hypothetical protein
MTQYDGQGHGNSLAVMAGKIGMADAARDRPDPNLIGTRFVEFQLLDLRRSKFGARHGCVNFHSGSFVAGFGTGHGAF